MEAVVAMIFLWIGQGCVLLSFRRATEVQGPASKNDLEYRIEPLGHFDMSYAEVQLEDWIIILAPANKIDHQPLFRPWKELLVVTTLKVLVEGGKGVEIDAVAA